MSGGQTTFRVKHYSISDELFSKGYPEGGGPCSCSSTCCEGGVYADVRERENILAHTEMIKAHMDETQVTDHRLWFEEDEKDDPDFASGRCAGTREINNKCAFLNRNGLCSIQVAAVANGMHKWALKPLFCILYPIEISDNVVSFDEMLQDQQACCSVSSEFRTPLFEACKEELLHLLGEDGYRMMEDHYRSLRHSLSQGKTV